MLLTFVAVGPFGRTVHTHGNPVWREYSYLGGMDAIAMGCLTAILIANARASRRATFAMGWLGSLLMFFILGFSMRAEAWGLGHIGLDMTILGAGTCMVIAAAATTNWKSPRLLRPVLKLGQGSYEVYLTHMFVVFTLFSLFVIAGKPIEGVPMLFVAVILISGTLGEAVARFYSEPMNRWLRERWGDDAKTLGSVIETDPVEKIAV